MTISVYLKTTKFNNICILTIKLWKIVFLSIQQQQTNKERKTMEFIASVVIRVWIHRTNKSGLPDLTAADISREQWTIT